MTRSPLGRLAAALTILVLGAAFVAGCADTEASRGAPAGGVVYGGDAGDGEHPSGALTVARFPNVQALNRTIWANGTLSPTQAMRAGPMPLRSPTAGPAVRWDVSELGVAGLPVILEADLSSSMTQGSAFVRFQFPSGEFRNNAFGIPANGNHHLESGMVRSTSEPMMLNLFYDRAEPGVEVPYVLSASVHVDPTVIRAAFPVGVNVSDPTQEFVVETVGEQRSFSFDLPTPNLMLWGPDGEFLGHHALFEARTIIPATAGPGEYVVILSQGGRSIRIHTTEPGGAALRALPQEFVISEMRTGSSAQRAEWTATYEGYPILVGVGFAPSQLTPDATVAVRNSAGPVVEVVEEGPWFNVDQVPDGMLAAQLWWDSYYGVPNLLADEYRIQFLAETAAGADPIRGWDFAVYWQRGNPSE